MFCFGDIEINSMNWGLRRNTFVTFHGHYLQSCVRGRQQKTFITLCGHCPHRGWGAEWIPLRNFCLWQKSFPTLHVERFWHFRWLENTLLREESVSGRNFCFFLQFWPNSQKFNPAKSLESCQSQKFFLAKCFKSFQPQKFFSCRKSLAKQRIPYGGVPVKWMLIASFIYSSSFMKQRKEVMESPTMGSCFRFFFF